MLGRVEIDCIGHELAVAADGALVPGLLCAAPRVASFSIDRADRMAGGSGPP